eukprot:5336053-Amphidinium_carterae.1
MYTGLRSLHSRLAASNVVNQSSAFIQHGLQLTVTNVVDGIGAACKERTTIEYWGSCGKAKAHMDTAGPTKYCTAVRAKRLRPATATQEQALKQSGVMLTMSTNEAQKPGKCPQDTHTHTHTSSRLDQDVGFCGTLTECIVQTDRGVLYDPCLLTELHGGLCSKVQPQMERPGRHY